MPNQGIPLDFERLFNSLPGRYVVVRPDLTVAAVSDEYLRATMTARADLVGRDLFEVFPENPADRAAPEAVNIRTSIEKVFATGAPDVLPIVKYDVRRPAAAGGGYEERFWRLASHPAPDAAGAVAYVVHHVEDVTERVRLQRRDAENLKINAELEDRTRRIESARRAAAELLEDAEIRLEAALEAGEIGTWTWDVKTDRIVADRNLAAIFGVSEEDAAGGRIENYLARVHPDDLPEVERQIAGALAARGAYEAEYRIVRPDGAVRWVVARGRVLGGADGAPAQMPGVVIDLTERRRTAEELRRSDERFRLVTRATNDAVWDWNLETHEVWWNDAVRTLFGYAPEEVGATSDWWYENIHPDDRERVVGGVHAVIDAGGENWSAEYRFRCADGGYKHVFDRGFAVHADGRPRRMLGAMQDVTGRRRVETELAESQQRLQLVLDSSNFGLWYCDLPFDVLNWSDQTKSHFWLPPEAAVTIEDFYRLIHEDDRAATRAAIDRSIETRTNYDVAYRTVNPADGRVKWIRAIGRGFYDRDNNPYRFDGVTIDVTRERLIQEERERLLASEKEARAEAENANRLKDEFLATLSHELRTPLSSILGWSRMLREKQIGPDRMERAIETIERNARSQAQLIEDILDVSRIISGKLRLAVAPVDLAAVIENALEAVRPAAAAKNIRLRARLGAGAPIAGDADRLQQIVWNLLSNGIKFTPAGGRVEIRLARAADHVEITVADDGLGIEAAALPYIFERFRQSDSSTTRQHGGLGLGLAIVRHMVELHGGTVRAASAGRGRGAVFTVAFPVIAEAAGAGAERDTGELAPPGIGAAGEPRFECPPAVRGLRVLLVDDEPDAREIIAYVFERCGARVTGAASVDEALAALAADRFDVLVSDIGMPGRDGYDLIREIRGAERGAAARLPAVALTAYARREDRRRALAAGFQVHVPKPVEPTELVAVVAALAAQSGDG